MALPSFDNGWREGQSVKPRILVLEIKDKDRPDDKALGWVLVEREETYRRDPRDGTIYEASIRLSYSILDSYIASYLHLPGDMPQSCRAGSGTGGVPLCPVGRNSAEAAECPSASAR